MISEDQFDELYVPMSQSADGDMMAPRYGDALAYAQTHGLTEKHIWAITEGDDDGGLYANPGPAMVNVIGYVVTEKAWDTGDEVATYAEPEPDEDDEPESGPSM
jgi:hypothetical protein